MKKVYEKKLTPKQRSNLRATALDLAQEVLPKTKNQTLIALCNAVIGLFTPTDRKTYMRKYMAAYRKTAPKAKNAPVGRARSLQRAKPQPKGADKAAQGQKSEEVAGFLPRTLSF